MRLLFLADGRSPIATNWISYFFRVGEEVHLASTFPCRALDGLASLDIIPMAMSGLADPNEPGKGNTANFIRRVVPVGWRTRLRQRVAPSSLPGAAKKLSMIIERVKPELVHAMRIPYEGMLATEAFTQMEKEGGSLSKSVLLVSVWGNDFTLHARSSKALNDLTRETLKRTDSLHTDCQRDRRLAQEYGFDPGLPSIVLPGGGGVQLDIFYPPTHGEQGGEVVRIINPRGFRAYVKNDTFFQAIPLVLEKFPKVRFICPGMQGQRQAEGWVEELGISETVELLPLQPREKMADLFRTAQIMVSVTTHDGTPNTLLEGMACGCFPVVGDIESLREWIVEGGNGLLVDPGDSKALAGAIIAAIENPQMRQQAMEENLRLVRERAEYGQVMKQAEAFYRKLID
jgi:glycosyltransferase involved in cell wall biosynthesis